jgi:hypothetical protein
MNKYPLRGNPVLYEINTVAWLFELSQKVGKPVTLGDVPPEEWDKLKNQGMDLIWLLGVWERSQEGRKLNLNSNEFRASFEIVLPGCTPEDIIGSCYSISSYGPDPQVGSWEELDHTREELNRRGMGLILDFLPNHTGMDHHWVAEHPDYYIQGDEKDFQRDKEAFFAIANKGHQLYIAHGRDPNFPPWTDTAQLNFFNPEVRQAMIQRLQIIADHCDGIRCDMAMLVLNDIFRKDWGWANRDPGYEMPAQEFWAQAINQVPDLIYIAEAYWDTEWTLQQLGFDFVYDKKLYDRIKSGYAYDVYLHLTAGIDFQQKLVRFIENHDEPRSLTAFGKHKAMAAAVLFATLPGLKLFFHGQMEGKKMRLPLQIRRTRPELIDPEIKAFYDKLLPLANEEIFHTGMFQLKPVLSQSDDTFRNLIAYTWKSGDSFRLVIVNLSQHPSCGRISLQDDVSESHTYSFIEWSSRQRFVQAGKLIAHPGLSFDLNEYQAQVWKIDSTPG